jgi:hypothetical protein
VSSIALPTLSIEPERRLGRWAAAGALASIAAMLGALVAANAAGHRTAAGAAGSRLAELQDFHAAAGLQALAVALRCVGLALSVGVGVYLFWLIRRRGGTAGRASLCSAIAGPVLVGAATVFGYFAIGHLAEVLYAAGPQTPARASSLFDNATALKLAGVFDFASRLVFAPWIAIASLRLMQLGLLGSFLGYFGVGAAAALVLIPSGDAMFIGWLASVGLIAWGYWPGGRPRAWDDPSLTGQPAGI